MPAQKSKAIERTCVKCGKTGEHPGFCIRKDGRVDTTCKECRRIARREYARNWGNAKNRADPVGLMLVSARKRAKIKGVPFSLKKEDISIPSVCPVLGIPMARQAFRYTDNSPSLDRIIPEKGYVAGNIVIVSCRANRIKNDATIRELQLVTKFYEAKIKD